VAKAVDGQKEVLFDPFHGGRRLSPEQCEALVEQVTGEPFRAEPEALAAVPLGFVVRRMLTNLKGCYLRSEDFARAARVTVRLGQVSPEDPLQQRDLGVCLLRAGYPGRAVNPLEAYLAAVPAAEDAETIRQLLGQARREVARWN
jgi:regulator of sirC expression with transglutaminase-like and TPR domain